MLKLSIFFYLISLACQIGAAVISIRLISSANYVYRWAWACLALGLTLMLGRRISPLFAIYSTEHYNFSDALLSVPISALLLLGMIGIRKIILQINSNNSLLLTLSQIDPLTHCFSRTEIFYRINEEINRAQRSNHSFALLEMDIDNFKLVNDEHGHHVGDEILVNLIRHTKVAMRSIDSVGRIGGEEFLILLPETNSKEALEAAERLRTYIANANNDTCALKEVRITISVGVTIFHPGNEPEVQSDILLTKIINEADAAMYNAKKAGKNRVALWTNTKMER